MIHKFNKEDWSGSETQINVRQSDSSFMHLGDDRYFLRLNKPTDFEGTSYQSGGLFMKGDEYPCVSITRTDDNKWTAFDGETIENAYLTRTHTNPHVACSMILHNIV